MISNQCSVISGLHLPTPYYWQLSKLTPLDSLNRKQVGSLFLKRVIQLLRFILLFNNILLLPQPQRRVSVETLPILFKLFTTQHQRPYLPINHPLRLLHIAMEVGRVDLANQHQIYDAAILPVRVVAGDEGHLQLSQAGDHFVHDIVEDLVDTHVLMDQVL